MVIHRLLRSRALLGLLLVAAISVPLAAQTMSVSPTSLSWGSVSVGTWKELSVTITNTSSSGLTGSVAGGSNFSANGYSITSGGGAFKLAAKENRVVVIRFTPGSLGLKASTLEITHNATNVKSPYSVPLSGTGVGPEIEVSQSSLDFGDVPIVTAKDLSFTITNVGANILSVSVGPGANFVENGFSFQAGSGSTRLGVKQSVTVTVRFMPYSGGVKGSTVQITHNGLNTGSPISMPVKGNGTVPQIFLDPTSLNFGEVRVGSSRDLAFDVVNKGSGILSGSVEPTEGFATHGFSFVSGAGSYALGPGQSRRVVVRFTPPMAGGMEANVSISHNATNEKSPLYLLVQGVGTNPQIYVAPTTLAFGNVLVGSTSDLTLRITNTGDGTLSGSVLGGLDFLTDGYSFANGGGAYSLGANQSKYITVRFAPPSMGDKSSTISITHNGSNAQSPIVVPVTGFGRAIQIAVDPTSLAFGEVEVGASKDLTVVISNVGNTVLSGSVEAGTNFTESGFSFVGGSGAFDMKVDEKRNVVVRFAPTSTGAKTASFVINHNATNAATPISVALTATGTAPEFSVDPSSLAFGDVRVGTPKELSLVITNAGSAPMQGTIDAPIDFGTNGFAFVSGSGDYKLAPKESQKVTIRFNPPSVGAKNSAVRISHNAGNVRSPVSVPVSGNGIASEIALNPSALAFGDVPIKTSKDLIVTITNNGSATLNGSVDRGPDFAANGYSIERGAGAFTLNPKEKLDVVVRLTPPSGGAKNSSLSIVHDAANTRSPATVLLTGNGTVPQISFSPTSLAFGNVLVGSTKDLTVTVSNVGDGVLSGSIAAGANFAAGGYSILSGAGAFALGAKESKNVVVRFAPTSTGSRNTTLDFTHNASNAQSPSYLSVTGTGAAPAIKIDPSSLAFGDVQVGTTRDLTVTISNSGNATLTGSVTAGANFAANGYVFQSGSGDYKLEGGASHQVVVRLAPTSVGSKPSSIQITHNAATPGSPIVVALSANGTAAPAPSIRVDPASLAFGDVQVGTTKDLTVTITNAGNAPLTGSVSSGTDFAPAGFSFQSGSGAYSLGAGESRQVVVRLAPTSVGATASALQISHNASTPASPISVSVSGNATAAPAPSIRLNPTSLTFGDVQVGSTKDLTLTIENTGNALLTGTVTPGASFAENGFSIESGDGAFSLTAGASKDVVVRLAPPSEGSLQSSLAISHNASAPTSPIAVALSGNGTSAPAPSISVDPGSLDFGGVVIGEFAERTVTITNTGSGPLTGEVTPGVGFGENGYSVESGGGAYALDPGLSLDVVVRLTPGSTGPLESALGITHDATNEVSPLTVSLSGVGQDAPAPTISVNPLVLSFGDVGVGSTLDLQVDITNTGAAPLAGEVSEEAGFGEAGFAVQAGAGPFVLEPAAVLSVVVRFEPADAGPFASGLVISHNDTSATNPLVVALTGTGVAANVAPIAVIDSVTTLPGGSIVIPVLNNDMDPGGGQVTFVGVVVFPAHGLSIPQGDGTVLYTPFAGFTDGTDSFQYQISNGSFTAIGTVVVRVVSGVASSDDERPVGFLLEPNYPNPFNPTTHIGYTLDRPGRVTLRVYDSSGRVVRTLVDQVQSAGTFRVTFEAGELPSGSYVYELTTEMGRQARLLTLLK